MKEEGIHEGCIEQIQRLYQERLYTGNKVPVDEKGRIRVDDLEMRPDVQAKIAQLWAEAVTENLADLGDLEGYRKDFYNLFGFDVDGVDYKIEADEMVNIDSIAKV
jgi:enoyl-[acyl-carrier protein] reductase/trans-2-enoyl-CoA reductase (NAD+)